MKRKTKYLLAILCSGFCFLGITQEAEIKDTTEKRFSQELQIPIIFHIVQYNQIDSLEFQHINFQEIVNNINFRINNVNIDNINEEYKNKVSVPNIKFWLPYHDENCKKINPVSYSIMNQKTVKLNSGGIDRHLENLKKHCYRDSDKFLNVWFLNVTDSPTGYAAKYSRNLDGIIIDIDELKYIGSSPSKDPFLLIHEIGHYLGLKHIWGHEGNPYLSIDDCIMDDGIGDTPKQRKAHIRPYEIQDRCDGNGKSNHQNFMDYSYDTGMFTDGQTEVMRSNIIKKRYGLLWKSNCEDNTNEIVTGFIKDPRDGQSYKWVQIGNQKWMTKNINYKSPDSKCYAGKESNCTVYGRLYNWNEAVSICPSGWRLPNYVDWEQLTVTIGNNQSSIRSQHGWLKDKNGTNDSGLSFLPSGYKPKYGSSLGLGNYVKIWLDNSNGSWAYSRQIGGLQYKTLSQSGQNQKYDYLSCRCIQDS